MAEVAPPPAVAPLRRELEFVKSLLKSGRSVGEMIAAANAAARVAARTVEEMQKSMHKKGCELTVRGLPTSDDWDWLALKRWLQSRGVPDIKYAAKRPELDVGVVRFGSEAQCSVAADMIPTCKPPAPGCSVTVERGIPPEYQDSIRSKRPREGDDEGGPSARRPKVVPGVCEAVCPWWQVPYSRQLTDKHQRIVEALAGITAAVDRRTYGSSKPDWVRAAQVRKNAPAASSSAASPAAAAALCCPLLGILRSPVLERYRNKSEFTAGLDEQEKPCVGFLRGAFLQGITCVGSPEPTRHTSRAAVVLAAAATSYFRDVSKFAVYDKRRQEGYWRLVLVRDGRRKTFLPAPQRVAPAAGTATTANPTAPAAATLDDATFSSLDAMTYLVTFGAGAEAGSSQGPPTVVADAAGVTGGAEGEKPAGEAVAAGEGSAAAAAAQGGETAGRVKGAAEVTAMETDEGAGSGGCGSSCGMNVAEVSEVEPEHPPPDEVLVMVQVNPDYPQALAHPATAARELRALTAALHSAAAAAGLPLTTVRVQHHTGVSNAAPADAPLLEVPTAAADAGAAAAGGEKEEAEGEGVEQAVVAARGPGYIYDALCDLRFRISPTAFFQVNSAATCVLYKIVGDWAAARPSTLLLDICCGTGTIGLTMARRVAKVVGVDSVASAIEDARVNASLNGITNAEFVTGKAEDALPGILAAHVTSTHGSVSYEDVVAVADPPRAGLHKSVVRALLGCEKIRRLVFVSCNPDNLVENVAMLCGPPDNRRPPPPRGGRGGGGRGGDRRGGGAAREEAELPATYTPFRPVKAVALDLFPHTAHVEAVMLLER